MRPPTTAQLYLDEPSSSQTTAADCAAVDTVRWKEPTGFPLTAVKKNLRELSEKDGVQKTEATEEAPVPPC